MARTYSGIIWKHNSIWLSDAIWDKIVTQSASAKKRPSAWLVDFVYNYDKEVKQIEKDKTKTGKSRSICVPLDKWNEIQQRAKNLGVTTSKYIYFILATL